MDIARLAVVVIVSYILGLGTGVVGGVVFSFREFSAPASVAATDEASPQPTKSATPTDDRKPTASPSDVSTLPSSEPEPASPAPVKSATPSTPRSAAPSTPDPETKPVETPSSTPGAVPETDPAPTASTSPASEPSSSPEKKPLPSVLSISANKGKGFAVFVDGNKVGATPLVINVSPDKTHLVKVAGGDKYKSWEQKVHPTAGEKRAIEATLTFVPPPEPPPVAAPAPRYYPPAPRYYPPPGGSVSGGGRPGVSGNTRW